MIHDPIRQDREGMELRVWNPATDIRVKRLENAPEGPGKPRFGRHLPGSAGIVGNRRLVLHRPFQISQIIAPQRLRSLGCLRSGIEPAWPNTRSKKSSPKEERSSIRPTRTRSSAESGPSTFPTRSRVRSTIATEESTAQRSNPCSTSSTEFLPPAHRLQHANAALRHRPLVCGSSPPCYTNHVIMQSKAERDGVEVLA
jgi:hypothetical protein